MVQGTSNHNGKNKLQIFAITESCVATSQLFKKQKNISEKDLSTITLAFIDTSKGFNQKRDTTRAKVLLDTGCSKTLINKSVLGNLKRTPTTQTEWATKGGNFHTTTSCKVTFTLPAFHENRDITWKCYVDDSNNSLSQYDMIIGRDLITELGINFLFSEGTMSWDHAFTPMLDPATFQNEQQIDSLSQELLYSHDPDTTEAERIKHIIDAKYSPADLTKVVAENPILNHNQQAQLLQLLNKFEPLFDGTLGTWLTDPVNIELKPDSKPYHARPYPVPHSQERKLKEEIERFCQFKILKKVNRSEWAAPMFTISKPDGSLRSLADLRELNKRIVRHPFPLPHIKDLLQKLEKFQWATSLDLIMGYHNILLTPDAARKCTVILPWGKYEYQRLPMGLASAPDIFQEKMSELMSGLDFARVYIDDLLIISKLTYEDHLEKVEQVLTRLLEAGLKVNATKSYFCRDSLEYLGYWITRQGVRPMSKKVKAIQNLQLPTTRKQLRRFIGMVNYYRDVWPKRAETLAVLSALTSSSVKYNWEPQHTKAFEDMKKLISRETLLTFPDFSEPFDIHTDASGVQLGACISQKGKPIAFYSRKLKDAQTRYTTTERELLSIVETLKEFRTILLGQQITVFTDHENLTYKQFNSDRVLRWRLYIEEYAPTITYVKGGHNVVADALSRLDTSATTIPETLITIEQMSEWYCYAQEEQNFDSHPLNYKALQTAQTLDKTIQKILKFPKTMYQIVPYHGGGITHNLVCFKDKIVVPCKLQKHVISWYHTVLCHPGINRTEESIGQHLWWPKMRDHITLYVQSCPVCQLNKRQNKKLGWLPPKIAEATPWDTLCVDLIGPYKINRKGKPVLVCRCVTMIDPATGWFEISQYRDKESITVANIVEEQWLSRYPWPTQVVHDRGSEFIGANFQQMLRNDYGIKSKPITIRNPQANAIVERVHQTIGNIIRTFELENNYLDETDPWTGILSATAFAIRTTYHTTLKKSPGQLVFGRDMILNVKHIANWELIRAQKQRLINGNNQRENSKRTAYTYKKGQQVLLKRGTENKYEAPFKGPYRIIAVNNNGTVKLRVGALTDTYNIRRLVPFHKPLPSNHGGVCNMRQSKKRRKNP